MAEPTPVRMACPKCNQVFNLPTVVQSVDRDTDKVTAILDRSEILAHYRACSPAAIAPAVASSELAGRINRMLDMRAYVGVGGSRACTRCGTPGKDCLTRLQGGEPGKVSGVPCCAACGNGDTHPVPQGTLSCAEWAVEHHKADQ